MSRRPVHLAAAAASIVLLVACGTGPTASGAPPSGVPGSSGPAASPSTEPSPAPSSAAASLLLRVSSEGGFINPSATLAALPIVEVWSDGRILTPGATAAVAPSPLLPAVAVRDVGAAGAAAITAAIREAGLDQPATGGPGIPGDSGSDTFTVTIDGQTTETRLAGGGPGPGGPGGPVVGGSGAPGREAAFALLDRLVDPTETWGAAAAPISAYGPTGYRVYAAPVTPGGDPATAQKPVPWPLAIPLADFGTPAVPDRGIAGLRQGAVLGADAAILGPILAAATVETGFTSGGRTWTLFVRPLLPDELGG